MRSNPITTADDTLPHEVAAAARSPLAVIQAIGKVAEICAASSDRDVRDFGEAMSAWVKDGAAVPLDAQLGLRRQGGVSPSRALALRDRNTMLRRLWQITPAWAGLAPVAAAGMMALSVRRYETDRWPRERCNEDAPSAEPAATWWRCLRLGVGVPDAKRIGQILSD